MNSTMAGETNLKVLLSTMKPHLNEGEYVFCQVKNIDSLDLKEIIYLIREQEGITIIVLRNIADRLNLPYTFICVWISLTVHSSLEAVGLTAAFSHALASEGISCNVVAGYSHDHIFVKTEDARSVMNILGGLARQ